MKEKEYYDKKGVSSSSLKWYEISPAYFKKRIDKEIEDLKTIWLERGKKIHMRILEPTEFEKNYITLDYELPKSEKQKQFCEDYVMSPGRKVEDKAYEAYIKNYEAKGKEETIRERAKELKESLHPYIMYLTKRTEVKDVLTLTDTTLIEESFKTVQNHKVAHALLLEEPTGAETFNEYPIFWKHPIGLDCKSMIDRLVIDHKGQVIKLIDIKTTSFLSDFRTHFDELKYYRQLAFYWMAIFYEFPSLAEKYRHETYIVAINTKVETLIETKVFKIEESDLLKGLDEIESLLSDIKWSSENDKWDFSRIYYEGDGTEKL